MKVPLTGGFYEAKSLIASAQRCLNLYPEKNPDDAPFPFTAYQTPGLTPLVTPAANLPVRCLYRASTGDLYAAVGSTIYYIDSTWTAHALGVIGSTTGIVSMSDNRLVVVIVDGTASGYFIDLTNARAFGKINSPAFYGADKVDYLDTFFLFNLPGTNQFYISASELSAALITGGAITAGTIVGGAGYSSGTHLSIPLTGGTGNGALADITVTAGAVTNVLIDVGGSTYQVGDVLSATPLSLGGAILTQTVSGGLGYATGTYTAVALTGGSGTGATATMTVAGGVVTSAVMVSRGQDYRIGDTLSVSPGSVGGTGAGFAMAVATVSQSGVGFGFTVGAVTAGSGAFDPLDIAAKSGASDSLVALIAVRREIWLIGALTSEIWYDAGAPDFTFQEFPGVFIEHGCAAKYSIAKSDLAIFWLGQDKEGSLIVFRGAMYRAERISTHAIEAAIAGYATTSDAIGFTYQQEGHVFYVLTFPTADRTWVFDLATELWHERAWTDANGIEHRHRANCAAFAYGANVVGDWQSGAIYSLDPLAYTDAGQPIVRRRGFPHLVDEGRRVCYDRFVAEMDVGTSVNTTDAAPVYVTLGVDGTTTLGVNPTTGLLVQSTLGEQGPHVSLRWSDTKGKSFGNPIELSIGSTGDFLTSMQARQLGMGRDRVFELFWDGAFPTALNGAYIDVTPAET